MALSFPKLNDETHQYEFNKILFKRRSGQDVTNEFLTWLSNTLSLAEGSTEDFYTEDMIGRRTEIFEQWYISDLPTDSWALAVYYTRVLSQICNDILTKNFCNIDQQALWNLCGDILYSIADLGDKLNLRAPVSHIEDNIQKYSNGSWLNGVQDLYDLTIQINDHLESDLHVQAYYQKLMELSCITIWIAP